MKKISFFILLMAVVLVNSIYGQNNNSQYLKVAPQNISDQNKPAATPHVLTETEVPLPDGFPKFIDTGNPDSDYDVYAKAKDKWISDNSEKYKQYQDACQSKKHKISTTELEQAPDYKKKEINNNPDKYTIVE